jgi:hypothetical protein
VSTYAYHIIRPKIHRHYQYRYRYLVSSMVKYYKTDQDVTRYLFTLHSLYIQHTYNPVDYCLHIQPAYLHINSFKVRSNYLSLGSVGASLGFTNNEGLGWFAQCLLCMDMDTTAPLRLHQPGTLLPQLLPPWRYSKNKTERRLVIVPFESSCSAIADKHWCQE